MNEILARTWQLFSQNRILVVVLFAQNFIVLLATGGRGILGSNALAMLALIYFQHVVMGGWLYQMKIILSGERKATQEDFLEGIRRYFWPMLTGCSVYIFSIMVTLIGMQIVASALFGTPDSTFVQNLVQNFQSAEPQALQTFQAKHVNEVSQIYQWAGIFIIGGILFAIFNILIGFWQEYVVFGNKTWREGWLLSRNLFFKQFRNIIYLGVIWLVPTLMLKAGALTGSFALGLLSYLLDLVSTTFFTLLFCHFIVITDGNSLKPSQTTPLETPLE